MIRRLIPALALVAGSALAASITITDVTVRKVHDGDTLESDLRIYPGVVVSAGVRVLGENAPEMAGPAACEKAAAVKARDWTAAWLDGHAITLQGVQQDKYGGRVEAYVVRDDGHRLDTDIIAAGLSVPYSGGTRLPWCKDPAP